MSDEAKEVVTPPEGAKLFAHTGGALIDVSADRPLPHGVAAWGWHGLGRWLAPEQHPRGQYAEGEAEALHAQKNERAVAGISRVQDVPPVPDWVYDAREKAQKKLEEIRRRQGLTE
jgi:hypothetical protein